MARTAVVRSASLTPDDAELADELAAYLAGGSFSQLTKMLLRTVGEPFSCPRGAIRVGIPTI